MFGVSFDTGLALAGAAAGTFVLAFWPTLGLRWRHRGPALTFLVVSLLYLALAFVVLAARPFDGFPASAGGDAGNHLYYKNAFVLDEPRVYEGMVSLYALVHWLNAAGLDDLSAFRFAWWLVVIACVVLPCALAGAGGQLAHTRAQRGVLYGAMALAIATAGFWIALPLLRYYQCDGFLSQVFALAPLTFAAATYAFVERRLLRVLTLVAAVGFYRFTYLLNAGDLALACAVALFVEWREAPPARAARWVLLTLALACVFGGVAAYAGLNKAIRTPGGFFAAPLLPQIVGLGLVSAVFGTLGPACDRFQVPFPAAHRRLARFLFIFTLAPTIGVSAWVLSGGPIIYYIQKYSFCAMVLGALCLVPMVATAVFALVVRARTVASVIAGLSLSVVTGLGLFDLASGADGYLPLLREGYAPSPQGYLQPLRDRTVWRIIATTLRNEHAEFGGFLTPRWPEAQFTNAHFARTSAGFLWQVDKPPAEHVWSFATYADAVEGRPLESAGHCVFWYEDEQLPAALRQRWSRASRTAVDRLEADPARSCETFTPRYAIGLSLAVCSRCFGQVEDARAPSTTTGGPSEVGVELATDHEASALHGEWTRDVDPPHSFVRTAKTLVIDISLKKPESRAYGLAAVTKAIGLVAGEALDVGIVVNGAPQGRWSLGTEWQMQALVLPLDTLHPGPNVIELALPVDARQSGAWLAIQSLHLGPVLSRAAVALSAVSARGSLVRGYYAPETAGQEVLAWSEGQRTSVGLILAPQDTDYDVEIDGYALTPLEPLPVEVRINTKTTVKAVIGKQPRTVLSVPRGAFTYGLNVVEFVYSKTARPSEIFEGSVDTREIAVRISRIAAAPAAPP